MEDTSPSAVDHLVDSNLPSLGQAPQAAHHRRHIRYATPEALTPPSPHFILESSLNNSTRPSATAHRSHRTMSASPPTPTAPAASSNHTGPANSAAVTEIDGQNHDRMETDEEDDSDGSDSEPDDDTVGSGPDQNDPVIEPTSPPPPGLPPPEEDEAMDTAPDNPAVQELPADAQAPIVILANEATGEQAAVRLVPVQSPPPLPNAPLSAMDDITVNVAREETPEATSEDVPEDLARLRRARRMTRGTSDEDDEEEGSDDSGDEEEHPYWVNLKEDTSAPDEREMKIIEATMDEHSALDHDHWEGLAFEALDDPEYVPIAAGRIYWTVQGVHGTAEKPNKEKIMRSPSVLIGGYYWNIKYFPHGNGGTEQLSVYIECSPTPYEDNEKSEVEAEASSTRPPANDIIVSEGDASQNQSAPPPTSTNNENAPNESEQPEEMEVTSTLSDENTPWSVATQISCIIYNPDEPRTNAHQQGYHRYCNDNPDWGWTRFHGPWDEIHKRQRFQRQALLRNDTLAFTAYIRTIEDPTKALWWHPPKDQPEWDSFAMTGVNVFDCHGYGSSALVAAISAWMYLTPIANLFCNTCTSDKKIRHDVRIRSLFEEVQDLVFDTHQPVAMEDGHPRLGELMDILSFYGVECTPKTNVVTIWEALRRILNYEISGVATVIESGKVEYEMFNEIMMLKQPDPLDGTESTSRYQHSQHELEFSYEAVEPQSVQETIDQALRAPTKSFRVWESFAGQEQDHPEDPSVLQIELHRQSFNKETRTWQKLTHKIEVEETISFNMHNYSLYGLIVHSGDLESGEYHSILRPQGPGTRWLKFGDRDARKVEILTSKQALRAHEGLGNSVSGATAVAHVVLYVRSDRLPSVLYPALKQNDNHIKEQGLSKNAPASDALGMLDSNGVGQDVTVYIYDSDGFNGYSGRGFCNLWAEPKSIKYVQQFSFAPSTTLRQMKEYLETKATKEYDPEIREIRVWPIKVTSVDALLFSSLASYKTSADRTLESLVYNRFWATLVDKERAPEPSVAETKTRPSQDEQNQNAARRAAFLSILASSSTHEALSQMDPSQLRELEQAHAQHLAIETALRTENRPNQSQGNGDLLVLDAMIAEAAGARPKQAATNKPSKSMLLFLKVFDAQGQTLSGRVNRMVKNEAKISDEVKRLLDVDLHEAWDMYREFRQEIVIENPMIKVHETFDSRCGGADDGDVIIIAQRRPTAAQITALEAEGKCINPIDYFQYLRGHDNPSIFCDHLTTSYFGNDYSSCTQKYGRPHGQGTIISLSGDAYTGNFVAGVKSGHGTMAYANGDTYTGEWKANEPNGQGKMVYAKTGNVYTGGFKKRRRHGKGTMQFEVADEEMQLCKVCYENEMDALFYDCGHVAACEECAKQLDTCPVCRRNVRAVVRIWRTW